MARRRQTISGTRLQRIAEAATAQAVTDHADQVMADSQKIVLFLDGDLAASGRVDHAEPGPRPQARARYTIVYARRRHEETHRRDGTPIRVSLPGRSPKFLEIPFKARELELPRTVERRVAAALRVATSGQTPGERA
jgi:hypothetical protein